MHVICEQNDLNKGLSVVSHALGTRSSTLAILSNVLVEASEAGLILSSTNLETGITYRVASQVKETGIVTLPAKLLSDLISSLPAGEVEIVVPADSTTAQIISQHSRSRVKGQDAAEFPRV